MLMAPWWMVFMGVAHLAPEGALLYISVHRAWLGGLKASHAIIDAVDPELPEGTIQVGPTLQRVLGGADVKLRVKRLY